MSKKNSGFTFFMACFTLFIICFTIGGFILLVKNHERKNGNVYPMTTVVVDVSEATDTVTVKDYNGNLWQFKGVEDWEINDIATLLMDSNGTEEIKDDFISAPPRYNGRFENWKR
jgi:cell division protein FtsX